MTVITYPNGQVLTSTALTPQQMNTIMQPLTCGLIGINPPDFSKVRVDWQTQGQPFQNVQNDVVYLQCMVHDVDYSRIRDVTDRGDVWKYNRGWRIAWQAYGPNATDNMRAIRSAAFLDYFNDVLSASNLFLINDPPEIVRLPEEINAQWWERADFHIDLYEFVTETITIGAVTSVEVVVENSGGVLADFTVTAGE